MVKWGGAQRGVGDLGMDTWLYIGNTGVNVLEILDLVKRGHSCTEIRQRCPGLSDEDLAKAAADILNHIVKYISIEILMGAPDSSAVARPARLHDETPWTADEDEELRRLVKYRFRRCAIARLLRRSEQAVHTRTRQIERLAR